MHGYDIHITLAADKPFSPASPGNIHRKQIPALIKYNCITGVDILWFSITHDSSTKSDHLTIDIQDRYHRTIPELVRSAIFLVDHDQTGVL